MHTGGDSELPMECYLCDSAQRNLKRYVKLKTDCVVGGAPHLKQFLFSNVLCLFRAVPS